MHASIGIAVTGPEEASAEELLRNADIAMYTAKSTDRRPVLYEPVLHDRLRRRRELALEVERGIERGEFTVHFQPVVSLVDGTVQAFEALARWQHPERGLLAPDEFLGVAEENGLISAIGARVREQAFACAASWQTLFPGGVDLGLWVNIAPAELTHERLVEDLALALTRSHLDARRLTVEITESSVIRDEHGALEAMHRIRDLGVRLSIDDFGTGYSSLARLAEFPIEMVKIPKPFVDRLVGDGSTPASWTPSCGWPGRSGSSPSARASNRPSRPGCSANWAAAWARATCTPARSLPTPRTGSYAWARTAGASRRSPLPGPASEPDQGRSEFRPRGNLRHQLSVCRSP